jgi:hypothetical protein
MEGTIYSFCLVLHYQICFTSGSKKLCKPLTGFFIQRSGQATCTGKLFSGTDVYAMEQ